MKTSRVYLLGSVAGIALLILGTLVHARLTLTPAEDYRPRRPDAAELDALRDFTAIQARGDFMLRIARGDRFAVDYLPRTPRGELSAEVVDGQLRLNGFGNGADGTDDAGESSLVTVTMPSLDFLHVEFARELRVSDFRLDALEIELRVVREALLENNRIGTLSLDSSFTSRLTLSANTIGSQQFEFQGQTRFATTP